MKKIFNLSVLVALLTIFGCKSDDDESVINVQDLAVAMDENPTNGQVVGTIETDGTGTMSFSISSQALAGALDINTSTGVLTVADAALFDFEVNPVITAIVSVVDASGPATVTINLNNLNEATIQDLTVAIDENPTNGQVVGTFQTGGSATSNFSITSQTPAGALNIDANTGELTVVDASLFDFETNPILTATISVSDAENPATATINLTNVNEINIQDFTVAIDENPTDGQVIGTVQTTGGAPLNFSITSQTPVGALNIDATTGELTVADPNLFDFETNPVITATITVDDAENAATVTINLNDVDEISVQNLTTDINENPTNGDIIGALSATSSGSLTYAITFQNPAGAVSIDQNTGELTVADATLFDFETNPSMYVVISVDNGVYSVSANATISINDVNEAATIGDFRDGGVVFWVDPTDNNHGLVCAVNDQSSNAVWGCAGTSVLGTSGGIGSGASNTIAIETACTTVGTAAYLATNYDATSFSDWFLPSVSELHEMYLNRIIVNAALIANGGTAFNNSFYWSSTEGSATSSYFQFLGNQQLQSLNLKSNTASVRAVRAF